MGPDSEGVELARTARRVDDAVTRARSELVHAVRHAAAAGMTQTDIAWAIGRSQPEVSRLLRFHGTSPSARVLRRNAGRVKGILGRAGGGHVRVFGSVATGRDGPESDLDLLFDAARPISLMKLSRLEHELSELLGLQVDLTPESALRPDLRDRILAEAVPL